MVTLAHCHFVNQYSQFDRLRSRIFSMSFVFSYDDWKYQSTKVKLLHLSP
ncbi:hypothetical protein Plhal304r1_c024g0081811 [Plasmopara halstedii]